MRWQQIRLQADILRLEVDVAEVERLLADPDTRAEAAWRRLMASVAA